jgi:hypothetical protein
LGEAAVILGEGEGALVSGGGSMAELVGVGFDDSTGSGKERISESADDVSTVICFVGCELCRKL